MRTKPWLVRTLCACIVAAAALCGLWLYGRSKPLTLVLQSQRFHLAPHQTALLQFRHVRFCDGRPAVTASLSFSGSALRKQMHMECGQSAQLSLPGPGADLAATVALTPAHSRWSPYVVLQIVNHGECGDESVETLPLTPLKTTRLP